MELDRIRGNLEGACYALRGKNLPRKHEAAFALLASYAYPAQRLREFLRNIFKENKAYYMAAAEVKIICQMELDKQSTVTTIEKTLQTIDESLPQRLRIDQIKLPTSLILDVIYADEWGDVFAILLDRCFRINRGWRDAMLSQLATVIENHKLDDIWVLMEVILDEFKKITQIDALIMNIRYLLTFRLQNKTLRERIEAYLRDKKKHYFSTCGTSTYWQNIRDEFEQLGINLFFGTIKYADNIGEIIESM